MAGRNEVVVGWFPSFRKGEKVVVAAGPGKVGRAMSGLQVYDRSADDKYYLELFNSLDKEKVDHACHMIRRELDTYGTVRAVREAMATSGAHVWIFDTDNFGHFNFGMGFRNWMRQSGIGEDYFGIGNLDDYYVSLIEHAVTMSWPDSLPEGWKITSNDARYEAIQRRLEVTDGQCPCIKADLWNEDTMCPCLEFREGRGCHCGLYEEVK